MQLTEIKLSDDELRSRKPPKIWLSPSGESLPHDTEFLVELFVTDDISVFYRDTDEDQAALDKLITERGLPIPGHAERSVCKAGFYSCRSDSCNLCLFVGVPHQYKRCRCYTEQEP